ncbi:MAG TPA: efflux RND transporter permease subunit [Candidatus Polarisedimenticolia bacterium]|nr:efflux RND transporter permease subunit [Candidatus Polarisedimenticolia bacterium]
MLSRLVDFSIVNRLVVLVLAGALLVFGFLAALSAPIDVFPEFAPPRIAVQTEAPGLTSTQVESLVTIPLEQALNGAPGLIRLRSSSSAGLSLLDAVFSEHTDVDRARQAVGERLLAAAARLPAGVDEPRMAPTVSASSTVLIIGLTATEGFDPLELRELADWTLRPRILAVPGVARLTTFGGGVKQYQVLFSPRALRDYDVGIQQVIEAASSASAVAAAGELRAGEQALPIRAQGLVGSLADLERSVVTYRNGVPVTLGQVARVRLGPAFKVGEGSVDGLPGIVVEIEKMPGSNSVEVTKALDEALAEIAKALPEGVTLHAGLFRQADFITRSVRNLEMALLAGAVLVAAVLLLFLLDLRSAAISLTAIPLSLLAAVLVLRGLGATLNTMTLGGLAIAIGEVVDDAIIDVENIIRRLRERSFDRLAPDPRSVILHASIEVRSAVVFATFIVALVFLPVFFISGLQGRLFAPLAYAYVVATLSSLLVALTVTPALASLLLSGESSERSETLLVRRLKGVYSRVLSPLLGRPRIVATGAVALVLLALLLLPWFGVELLPDFQESNVIVHMVGLPGTSLDTSVRAAREAERAIHGIDGVVSTGVKVGRAELGEDAWGPEQSEMIVALDPRRGAYGPVLAEVRRHFAAFPGFVFSVKQFLRERIEEVISGSHGEVALRLQGPDLEILRAEAARDAGVMASIRGADQVQVEREVDVPQVEIRFDREAAARDGLTMENLREMTTATLFGVRAGEVYEGQKVFDVWVKGEEEFREDPRAIGGMPIDLPSGGRVPLETVARIEIGQEPNTINRQSGTRQIVVTSNAVGRDIGGFAEEARRRVEARRLPPGYFRTWEGEYEAQKTTRDELLLLGAAAAVGIFLLLCTDFGAARPALLVMANLPLALVGGIAAAAAGGGRLSIGSLVGLITLFGISTRNSIMLVSHYHRLESEDGAVRGPDLILRGSLDRLSPILMTALVTGLGLLPLAIGGGRAGQEIEHPMAVVILGGLASSTLLNLLVLPPVYLRWRRTS